MINADFEGLKGIITARRTTKTDRMSGAKIPGEWITQLLQLGDAAPTHGRTEPWRFMVYEGAALEAFCTKHAELYWEHTEEDKRQRLKYDKLKSGWETASHLIIVAMRRTPDTKIPLKEEYAATTAAIQNMLLGSQALGLAAIWSTGGMTYHEAMKEYLGLGVDDQLSGMLYLGFPKDPLPPLVRRIPLEEKTTWNK